jgi:ParB family transcriptional regulator, chromosome partitioning protein
LDERADGTIAELTGLDQAVVQRCKKLLDFPRKYQDMMLYEDPDSRVKADFFIELYAVRNDRFVNSLKWFDRDKFTDAMLKRYLHGKLKAVTDFRIMKQHIANAKKAGKEGEVGRRLKAFTEDENLTLDSLQVDATAILEAAALQKRADKFRSELAEIDVDGCLGEEDFWTSLESLLETIRETLRAAGRRPKR